ncbi:unnamed protein product [Amaranthus hypochondriacus]
MSGMGKSVECYIMVITISLSMMLMNSEIIVDEFGSNILFGGGGGGVQKERNLMCTPNGEPCASDKYCCPGNSCQFIGVMGFCAWCPTAGYPCGAMSPCCPGLSCDGFFSGTCH